MANVSFSSRLKGAVDWLSSVCRTPSTSWTTTTVADGHKKLKETLDRIKAILLDAEKRDIIDESFKLMLSEIKDVAFDAEDLLDEFQYRVLRAQVENGTIAAEASRKRKHVEGEEEVMPLSSSASNIAASEISTLSNNMTGRIKKIGEKLDEILKFRDDFHFRPEDGKIRHDDNISEYPHPTSHMIVEQQIYGREKDSEKLIEWLFSDKGSKFEVLVVVGKGGLGKTTLARLVYNHQKVKDYFQERMWIYVSNDFNIVKLTRAMIESITGTSCTSSDQLIPLQKSLQKNLRRKRVLLVLDDVWNDDKGLWESLSIPFRDAEIMIRIIVTARNDSVAEAMQTTDPYHLQHLPEQQCWLLFMSLAFCGRDPEKFPWLEDIGKKIVEKCDGLPLAVKSLGGLLQHEEDEESWNVVLHSKLWDNETEILPALMLSYIRMPSHLKPCFEICSMFPKNHLFGTDELAKLWAAHGYIHNGEENAVEKIGYMYFNELHRRSFFDEDFGKMFKMHDNIHDLAHYVHVGTDLNNVDNKHKIRHLSIQDESLESYLDDIGALRSLIAVQGNSIAINDLLQLNIRRLAHLRYLHIRLYRYTSDQPELLLEGIGNFISLRHLELDVPDAKMKLTKSIGDLYNLVLLAIKCGGLVELPETFQNLVSLTTIKLVGFQNDQLPALGQLPFLTSLYISNFDNLKSIGNEFYGRGGNNRRDHVAFKYLTSLVLQHMPKWKKWDDLQEGDFPRLQKLEINMCRKLASLPSLQNLGLLSHICLRRCDSLQILTEASLPPNLTTLENYQRLKLCWPQGFGELKKFERLSGTFEVRTDMIFGILKKLLSLKYLILSELRNAHSAWNDEACLRECSGIEKLVLNWSLPNELVKHKIFFVFEKDLHLVVERDHNKERHHSDSMNASFSQLDEEDDDDEIEEDDDEETEEEDDGFMSEEEEEEDDNEETEKDDDDFISDYDWSGQTDEVSFSLLEKLQPHTNLEELYIIRYYSVGYPSWIGHPSFDRLNKVHLLRCKIEQLPTLGQLPSIEHLHLHSVWGLKKIGSEFCRGIDNCHSDDAVAFPALIELVFKYMHHWEEWDGVRQGDFPKLESLSVHGCPRLSSLPVLQNIDTNFYLSIYKCPNINILVDESFPPNVKALRYQNYDTRIFLSPEAKLLKLESLKGVFWVRNDDLFGILRNLPMNTDELIITALRDAHNVMEAVTNLKSQQRLRLLTLKWSTDIIKPGANNNSLCLVVEEDEYEDDGTNQTENASFFVLKKLQPHVNLQKLDIEGYDGVGYPSWIGHPSFNKLTRIDLHHCNNDRLPTLGQLPSLELLCLRSISSLKRIGDEFCRGTTMNNDHDNMKAAFPSLKFLTFKRMYDWEEWHGVLEQDFPELDILTIENCPSLRKDVDSFPQRLLKYERSIFYFME